ncbi:MAG: SDR family oxidoreductase [Hydrogenophaga sp.]|uniref:SDR family oxidoreductase n=1 Tax=Hydrogenophaga sp. TaxID=1904254 RepID=UPI001D6B4B5C|nr:SDR family oxidoreductase [Hydrogenophaga sp.]MBX3609644.1 SDR family oxidoreductase [Hydrogenophaga sp.]
MKLDQRRILITGAGGGIGRAMVEALNASGARTMGVARRQRSAVAGDPAEPQTWLQGDLTLAPDIDRVARAAIAWGADTVVHAAGVPAFGAFGQQPAEQTASVLQINLWSPMALTQALLPHLHQLPDARVVFVGSALGRIGIPGSAVYGATKAGLHRFAEALRRELAGSPVSVQWLGPRATQTAFNSPESVAFNQATGTASDPPEVVAEALLALLRSGAAERHIGFPERLAVRLNGALGPLIDGGFRKHRDALFATPSEGVTP